MKKLIVILNILNILWTFQLYAQQNHRCVHHCISSKDSVLCRHEQIDSVRIVVEQFITPIIFDVNKYTVRPTPQLKETVDSILNSKKNLTQIWIKGSTSPEGPVKWNQQLGQYRAEALADYIVQETGLDRQIFCTYNLGEDWCSLKDSLENHVDFPNRECILAILSEEQNDEIRKRKIRELDEGMTWRRLIDELFPPLRNARLAIVSAYPKFVPIAPKITLLTPPVVPLVSRDLLLPTLISPTINRIEGSNWKVAIKNNLLFDVALVANLGIEISPWTHWSLDIPVWYSPYNISSTRKIRLLAIQPEFRWWLKEAMNGHFIGLHTHVAGFNIALNDYARYQDPNHALWGIGLSYGYAMSLGKSEHWSMEFSLGAGFANYQYDAYRNWNNGPKFKSGSDYYWGITRAGIALSYKWDLSHRNKKK